jgi:hypothetical protein
MLSHLQQRGVTHLVHFTKAQNVPSILRYGLLSRDELAAREITHAINDPHRFDYVTGAICLSVSFPNYRMFYRLRQEHPTDDWVVLRLRPDLVACKRCAFSYANAATRSIAHSRIAERMTLEALEGMFADHEGMPPRATLDIPDSYPTNPQAEILVLDAIEPNFITDVIVDVKERVNNYPAMLALSDEFGGQSQFLHGKTLFDARSDYAHWRATQHG